MNCIHKNEVNKIAERNLLHDILNLSKQNKNLNSHYSTILHECQTKIKGREEFDNFLVLLDSGFSSTIVMVK